MERRIRGFYDVEVFHNEHGDIVIKQDSGPLGSEDMFVFLPPEHVPTLIRFLTEATEESRETGKSGSHPG